MLPLSRVAASGSHSRWQSVGDAHADALRDLVIAQCIAAQLLDDGFAVRSPGVGHNQSLKCVGVLFSGNLVNVSRADYGDVRLRHTQIRRVGGRACQGRCTGRAEDATPSRGRRGHAESPAPAVEFGARVAIAAAVEFYSSAGWREEAGYFVFHFTTWAKARAMQHWIDRTGIARRPVPKLGESREEAAEARRAGLAWAFNTGAVAPVVRAFVDARAGGR